jgi:hypothetical protein
MVRTLAEATLALVLFSDTSRIDGGTLRRGATISVRLLGVGLPLTIVLGSLLAGVPHVHPHQDERFECLAETPPLTSTAPAMSSERAKPSTCPEGPSTASPTPEPTRCASGLSLPRADQHRPFL